MKAGIRILQVVFAFAALLPACTAMAGELIYSQPEDNWTTFYSFVSTDGATSYEAADDFQVTGNIDRVVVNGYISNSTDQVLGVYVRFYQFGADGKPGALTGQYYLQAGDPNLKIEPTGAYWIDVKLTPPFSATGKTFLSVQPVTTGPWNWWNANHLHPAGQWVYTRSNSGTWSHPISIVTGQPYDSDLDMWLYGVVTGPPQLNSLSATSLPRSGYLEIFGVNFGASGKVLIDGLQSPFTKWTSSRIVAYVPESARLTTVPVQVITTGGASNTLNLLVTSRTASGRLKWRFRMDGPYSMVRPAIGPDGTVYSIDIFGHLYALSPDGGLKWVVRGAGDKGVAVGLDGTVFAGSEDSIKAYYPDGTSKWTFVQNPRAFILLGISVGPDGNIYGVATQGIGVFSLTPAGNLRWTQPEPYSRPIVDYAEIVFGPNGSNSQLYFSANNHTRALRLDGNPVFTLATRGQPEVGPSGSVHIGGGTYSPGGSLVWQFSTPLIPPVDAGSDGIIYGLSTALSLYGVNPNGTQRWHSTLPNYAKDPIVDPLNSQVILGGAVTLDQTGFVLSVGTSNGATLWTHQFPIENGFNQFVNTRAKFTLDGKTFYMITATATGDNNTSRSFINAIDAGAVTPPPPSKKLRSTNITLSAKLGNGVVTVTGNVTVKDENAAAVPGAMVYVQWTYPSGTVLSKSVLTNTQGIAQFQTSGKRGTYKLTVTNITKSSYTFDSAGSVLTKSITR